ncbi:MAG: hypothetical protein AB7K09_03580 [Planctomycetota bacterium]
MSAWIRSGSLHDLMASLGFREFPIEGSHDMMFRDDAGHATAVRAEPNVLLTPGVVDAFRRQLTGWGCIDEAAFDRWAESVRWTGPLSTPSSVAR